MFRSALGTMIVFVGLGAVNAQAKLISATLPAPDDAAFTALHKPTGCQAKVVVRGGIFFKAQITDPACLPKGVKARDIPSTRFDFDVITPK